MLTIVAPFQLYASNLQLVRVGVSARSWSGLILWDILILEIPSGHTGGQRNRQN